MDNKDGIPMVMSLKDQLKEAKDILKDIKRCGEFYNSAIELNIHAKDFVSGEEIEKRIDKLLEKSE